MIPCKQFQHSKFRYGIMLVGETEEKDLQANFIDISEELKNSGA